MEPKQGMKVAKKHPEELSPVVKRLSRSRLAIAPDRDVLSDHGIIDGRLIGGGSGNLLNVHSGSEITSTVPDGGSTLALLGAALVGLTGLKRKFAV